MNSSPQFGVIFTEILSSKVKISNFLGMFLFLVCPMPGYKKIGTFYREEDFHENTFELEDIFADSFLAKLKNTSNFSIKTIRTIVYGRCYTIQILQKISGLEVEDCLKFKREFDVNLLVHTEGSQA